MPPLGRLHFAIYLALEWTLTVMVDSLQIVKPVPIVAKDLLPLLATDNDVIKRPSNFISQY